jgi:hypothetical protein
MSNNIFYGFVVLFPLEKMTNIPGILFAPLNIQEQNTIASTGRIVPSKQLTHNQSYQWSLSSTSVNSRTRKSHLLPCVYGGVVCRLVNWVVAAQWKYPTTQIYATKIYFKLAYRCLHISYQIAKQCCTQLPHEDNALMALCFTFGGTPRPFKWGVISEAICDRATALVLHNNWNPNDLHAPNQENFPPPIFLPNDILFEEGKELIVNVSINKRGTHNIYIDNLIGLGLDLPKCNNNKHLEAAPLLAINVCL